MKKYLWIALLLSSSAFAETPTDPLLRETCRTFENQPVQMTVTKHRHPTQGWAEIITATIGENTYVENNADLPHATLRYFIPGGTMNALRDRNSSTLLEIYYSAQELMFETVEADGTVQKRRAYFSCTEYFRR